MIILENYPYVALFLSMVVQVVFPPLPAELIVVTAGRMYDVGMVTLFGGAGLFTGSVLVFYFGRYLQFKFSRLFDRRKTRQIIERLRRIETLLLWVRILPYNPSDIISYGAGIAAVQPGKYIAVTLCTSFVRVLFLAVLGSYVTNIKAFFQVGGVLVLSALIGAAIAYGDRGKNNKKRDIKEQESFD